MVNVGIVGTGVISQIFMEVAKSVENLEFLAVASRDITKAQDFANKNNIGLASDQYGELLNDDRVNTVYVALPNSLHFDYALRAVRASKSVIVEKPFVSTLAELDELVLAAEENGVYLFELDRVVDGLGFETINAHLKEIEPVRLVTINFSQYSRRYDALLAGEIMNVFSDVYSGGALVDLGVYSVYLVTGLFGLPQRVIYCADQLPNTVDLCGNLTLQYEGMIAGLVQSKNSRSENRMSFQGEKGTIYASQTPSRISKVEIVRPDAKSVLMEMESDGTGSSLREIVRIIDNGDRERYLDKLAHIRTVMDVLVRARKSAGIVFQADKRQGIQQ
ncbi:Gfo/Idh/MocA family oxidoreductase [bacterium]|nr:Gfo/Idh/MocA family oxidoreductase [bacterium]